MPTSFMKLGTLRMRLHNIIAFFMHNIWLLQSISRSCSFRFVVEKDIHWLFINIVLLNPNIGTSLSFLHVLSFLLLGKTCYYNLIFVGLSGCTCLLEGVCLEFGVVLFVHLVSCFMEIISCCLGGVYWSIFFS